MRSSCETVATKSFRLLQQPLAGDVAKGVDDPVGDPNRDEGEPEIAAADLDGKRTARRRALLGDRNARQRLPVGKDVRERQTDDLRGGYPGHHRRRAIPESNRSGAVDEEDPVADGREHPLRLFLFGGHGARRRFSGLESLPSVEPRVPHRSSHLRDETLEEPRSSSEYAPPSVISCTTPTTRPRP